MLMKDSLGGNAKTLMFVNISPAEMNADESNTSLQYAKRVKMIKNIATKNVASKATDKMNKMMQELQGEIGRLEGILETNQITFNRGDVLSRVFEESP